MLRVQIVDREAVVWEGETAQVIVPSHDGALGILPGREPLMALLVPGEVSVATANGPLVFDVERGFVTVDADEVFVVVENSTNTGRTQA